MNSSCMHDSLCTYVSYAWVKIVRFDQVFICDRIMIHPHNISFAHKMNYKVRNTLDRNARKQPNLNRQITGDLLVHK